MIVISSKIRMPSWDFAGIKASNGRYGIHEYLLCPITPLIK